jgi:hypothetical protein
MFSVAYFGVSASQSFGVSAFSSLDGLSPPSVASWLGGFVARSFSNFARHSAAFSG